MDIMIISIANAFKGHSHYCFPKIKKRLFFESYLELKIKMTLLLSKITYLFFIKLKLLELFIN